MTHFDLSKFDATPAHYFIKMLLDKGILLKNITQNIDNLEEKTGIDMGMVCQAHGANRGAVCGVCHKRADKDVLQKCIKKEEVMRCPCGGPIKPDITFFGEGLPDDFMVSMKLCP
jgi:NAD-dependent SIR2 family protein deacetylase